MEAEKIAALKQYRGLVFSRVDAIHWAGAHASCIYDSDARSAMTNSMISSLSAFK